MKGKGFSQKQEKLVTLMAENVRQEKPLPIGAMMRKAGYAKSTSEHPHTIVKSNHFLELLERHGVTDRRIATVIKDGLFAKDGKKKDHNVRYRFVNLACQLKGHLKEGDNGGLESITQMVEGLKKFDIEFLLVIKNKLQTTTPAQEPIDAIKG